MNTVTVDLVSNGFR